VARLLLLLLLRRRRQVYNDTVRGASYGTALFISKSAVAYTSNAGPVPGLYSLHDSVGDGNGACAYNQSKANSGFTDCSWQNANAWQSCPGSPVCLWNQHPTAAQYGMPASVAGGTGAGVAVGGGGPAAAGLPSVPKYGASTMTTYHNYKLIWTPNWLAWMIDTTVMRNESNWLRLGLTAPPATGTALPLQGQYVPWRPVTLRPLIRTNIGSAPAIVGTLLSCANAAKCASLVGQTVSAPAGLISDTAGNVYGSHYLYNSSAVQMASVNLTLSGSAYDGSWANGAWRAPFRPSARWLDRGLIAALPQRGRLQGDRRVIAGRS
jgi:hypothetical protein